MRFLVVDDDPDKVTLLRDFLMDQGVSNADILIEEHAAGARMRLEDAAVDVLLLDVLLPVRKGAPPQGENSIELLRQIVEDGTSPAPRHIFGITASQDTRSAYAAEFSGLVTQVLHVTAGETAWRDSLLALCLLLRRIDEADETHDYDICVLNALRAPEQAFGDAARLEGRARVS